MPRAGSKRMPRLQAKRTPRKEHLIDSDLSQLLLAQTLQAVDAMLTSQLGLQEVLEKILDFLGCVVKYDSASIQLFDENGTLKMEAGRGFKELDQTRQVLRDFSSQMQSIWSVPKLSVVPNTRADPDWITLPGSEYIRSWVGAPLMVKGHFIGVLNVDSSIENAYDTETGDTVMAFANQASIAIENARLFEAERSAREQAEALRSAEGQRVAELEAVRRTSLSLTASLELPQVLKAILKGALDLLPEGYSGYIFLYNLKGDNRLTFGADLWPSDTLERPSQEPRQNGLTYTVARSGQAVVISDMRTHPLYSNTSWAWNGSIVGLPLKIGERVVGVMNIGCSQPRVFPKNELRVLRLLADHAAIAIENARLYEQAEIERRHLALLYDIGRELSASLDPDEILNRALSLTCQALGGLIGEAFLYVPEENRLKLSALYGWETCSIADMDKTLDFYPMKGLVGWVFYHRQAISIPEVSQDSRWFPSSILEKGLIHSAIAAPILASERPLGTLSVLHTRSGAFSEDHLALMLAICQQVGLALSNASRYQQVERRLAEITLIQDLTQTFNQRLDTQALLDEVVTQLARQLGYANIGIYLVENDRMVLKAHSGQESIPDSQSLLDGVLGRVARTGPAAYTPAQARWDFTSAGLPAAIANLAIPILVDKVVVGVIHIEANQDEPLSVQDRDLLQVLAGQISIALEKAVLYERVLHHAEDLKRTVDQRTSELTELYELSQEIGFTHSYEELLHLLMNHLRTALGSDLAVGCLAMNEYGLFAIQAGRQLNPDLSKWLQDNCLEAYPQFAGKELSISLLPGEDFNPDFPPLERITSIIHVPIWVGHKIVGILAAGSEQEHEFGDEQTHLLKTFANQAAVAAQRLTSFLTAEQKRLEGLVEHLPVGVLLLDAEQRLLVANPNGRMILSMLNGREDGIISHLGPFPVKELIEAGIDLRPVEIILDSSPQRYFEVQVRPVNGESLQWVVMLREVTQERDNQARIQMQERLATVGQLAAGIAHDFNNIMAAILIYTDLLRRDPNLPQADEDRIAVIQQQVYRAASLIRQILDFSRRSVMEQSPLDLLPFMKEFEKMLKRVMPETIQIELETKPGCYWMNADPTRLQQIFINLALNARDSMPYGGILRIQLSRFNLAPGESPPIQDLPEENWIRIVVKDTGEGIPPEVLPHIFEPFFTTKPVGQGTGLGLAQVYGIVKQHDAYIDVSSRVGKGTIFTIYIPALEEPQTNDLGQESAASLCGNGETLLLVEDDPATLAALKDVLEAQNYHVVTAPNGLQAMSCYEQANETISLVISDVVMPQMGGLALYRNLKKHWPGAKMLFITGHPVEEESQVLLEKGGVNWLQKPFSMNDLGVAVKEMLEQ